MTSSPTTIVIVDDHFMIRSGLTAILSAEPDFLVVGEARDGASAHEVVCRLRPDVVLMDGVLPDIHGVEVTRRILATWPEAKVIILSVNDTAEDVHLANEAGALGYIPKSSDESETLQAIRIVASGGRYLPRPLLQKLAKRRMYPTPSTREVAVLRLAADGRANKEIAAELGIGEASVKTYIARLFSKLGARDRTQAVTIAREAGFLRSNQETPPKD